MYIKSMNRKIKKNGLMFLNKCEKWILDRIINKNMNDEKIANL